MLTLHCPNCAQALNLLEKHLGVTGRCLNCREAIVARRSEDDAEKVVVRVVSSHRQRENAGIGKPPSESDESSVSESLESRSQAVEVEAPEHKSQMGRVEAPIADGTAMVSRSEGLEEISLWPGDSGAGSALSAEDSLNVEAESQPLAPEWSSEFSNGDTAVCEETASIFDETDSRPIDVSGEHPAESNAKEASERKPECQSEPDPAWSSLFVDAPPIEQPESETEADQRREIPDGISPTEAPSSGTVEEHADDPESELEEKTKSEPEPDPAWSSLFVDEQPIAQPESETETDQGEEISDGISPAEAPSSATVEEHADDPESELEEKSEPEPEPDPAWSSLFVDEQPIEQPESETEADQRQEISDGISPTEAPSSETVEEHADDSESELEEKTKSEPDPAWSSLFVDEQPIEQPVGEQVDEKNLGETLSTDKPSDEKSESQSDEYSGSELKPEPSPLWSSLFGQESEIEHAGEATEGEMDQAESISQEPSRFDEPRSETTEGVTNSGADLESDLESESESNWSPDWNALFGEQTASEEFGGVPEEKELAAFSAEDLLKESLGDDLDEGRRANSEAQITDEKNTTGATGDEYELQNGRVSEIGNGELAGSEASAVEPVTKSADEEELTPTAEVEKIEDDSCVLDEEAEESPAVTSLLKRDEEGCGEGIEAEKQGENAVPAWSKAFLSGPASEFGAKASDTSSSARSTCESVEGPGDPVSKPDQSECKSEAAADAEEPIVQPGSDCDERSEELILDPVAEELPSETKAQSGGEEVGFPIEAPLDWISEIDDDGEETAAQEQQNFPTAELSTSHKTSETEASSDQASVEWTPFEFANSNESKNSPFAMDQPSPPNPAPESLTPLSAASESKPTGTDSPQSGVGAPLRVKKSALPPLVGIAGLATFPKASLPVPNRDGPQDGVSTLSGFATSSPDAKMPASQVEPESDPVQPSSGAMARDSAEEVSAESTAADDLPVVVMPPLGGALSTSGSVFSDAEGALGRAKKKSLTSLTPLSLDSDNPESEDDAESGATEATASSSASIFSDLAPEPSDQDVDEEANDDSEDTRSDALARFAARIDSVALAKSELESGDDVPDPEEVASGEVGSLPWEKRTEEDAGQSETSATSTVKKPDEIPAAASPATALPANPVVGAGAESKPEIAEYLADGGGDSIDEAAVAATAPKSAGVSGADPKMTAVPMSNAVGIKRRRKKRRRRIAMVVLLLIAGGIATMMHYKPGLKPNGLKECLLSAWNEGKKQVETKDADFEKIIAPLKAAWAVEGPGGKNDTPNATAMADPDPVADKSPAALTPESSAVTAQVAVATPSVTTAPPAGGARNPEDPVQLTRPVPGETADQRSMRIGGEQLLKDFYSARTAEAKLTFILESNAVAGEIEEAFPSPVDVPSIRSMDFKGRLVDSGTGRPFGVFDVRENENGDRHRWCVPEVSTGNFKIDWGLYRQLADDELTRFLADPSSPPKTMRLLIRRGPEVAAQQSPWNEPSLEMHVLMPLDDGSPSSLLMKRSAHDDLGLNREIGDGVARVGEVRLAWEPGIAEGSTAGAASPTIVALEAWGAWQSADADQSTATTADSDSSPVGN